MHNIRFIRKNSELFIKKIKTRNVDLDYKIISDLDEKNRKLITDKENLERDKKEISKKKDKSLLVEFSIVLILSK